MKPQSTYFRSVWQFLLRHGLSRTGYVEGESQMKLSKWSKNSGRIADSVSKQAAVIRELWYAR